jgi:hypothetical protein
MTALRSAACFPARTRRLVATTLLPLAVVCAACESTSGGYGMGGGAYYGSGIYDPWYTGGDDWDDVDISLPPDGRPSPPVRPEHPIARPPPAARPMPRPMPSIPSRPRPAVRR